MSQIAELHKQEEVVGRGCYSFTTVSKNILVQCKDMLQS